MADNTIWGPHRCTVLLSLTVLLVILLPGCLVFLSNLKSVSANWHFFIAWLVCIALLLFFCVVCGKGIIGRYSGVLIDSRYVMSLSRIQMLIWTLLFVSTLIVAFMINQHAQIRDAVAAIDIQWQLVALMGLSTTSLVGSPLILSVKTEQTPAPSEVEAMRKELNQEDAGNDGKVATNQKPSEAKWSDLFTGEEVGNAANVDLARVQFFYFTVITALVYAVMLGNELLTLDPAKGFDHFPALNQTLLTLIAISHGGYLTAKAFPHTKSDKNDAGATSGEPDSSSKAMG